ncbi:MAG: hypothetical protein D6706_02210 [Chloroflexi bacterium]|nr:MAG: hypothetical protein D6706_02210 [Chloroflexota bacterium]
MTDNKRDYMTDEIEEVTSETEQIKAQAQKGRSQKKKRSKRNQNQKLSPDEVNQMFAACARCGFFWAAFRVEQGNEVMETAVQNMKAGWLTLPWNQKMRLLVLKSYGVRVDIDYFHVEGICPDCRRRFSYQQSETEGKPDLFRIELKPRVPH